MGTLASLTLFAMAALQQESSATAYCAQFKPLKGSDGNFTEASIQIRLPKIIKGVCSSACSDSELPCDACKLAQDIACDRELPMLPALPERSEEEQAIDRKWRKWLASWQSMTWQTAPWFVVETYAYRLLLQAVIPDRDPFKATKRAALAAAQSTWSTDLMPLASACAVSSVSSVNARTEHCRLLLLRSLWGNRADLSLSGGKILQEHMLSPAAGDAKSQQHLASGLLHDGSDRAVRVLMGACQASPESGTPPNAGAKGGVRRAGIMLFADNAGLELLSDLLLIGWLLECGAPHVTLALKPSPILVSDATQVDLQDTLEWMQQQQDEAGQPCTGSLWLHSVLQAALQDGRLRVVAPHWTVSPLAAWEMDPQLTSTVAAHAVAVFKGDANYRRLLGDRHVPFDTPVDTAMGYLPTTSLALRTAKSGVLCGVPLETCVAAAIDRQPQAAAALNRALSAAGGRWGTELHNELLKHDQWLVSGHFGVVQVVCSADESGC